MNWLQVWDETLAQMASEWAEGCVYEHGQPTNISPYNPIGQNLYITTGNLNIESAVGAWYNEIRDYDYDANSCSAVCGHYTQIVWDDTSAVGCAHAFCSVVTGFSNNANYVVCNYGPA